MAPVVLKLNKYRFRSKILAVDYDWTLVRPKGNRTFPKDVEDWRWWRSCVPAVLRSWYDRGYGIIVFTNQTKRWKVDQIRVSLEGLGVPMLVAIAFDETDRKPSDALFRAVVPSGKCKLAASFFVGDALGRPNDWSDTDRRFAEAVGLRVVAPEEAFAERSNDSGIRTLSPVDGKEIVVFVGYPGSGKTTAAAGFSEDPRYVVLHGDDYKTGTKLLKAADEALADGKSVAIDATNPSREKRAPYVKLAEKRGAVARCAHVSTSFEVALERNNRRPEGLNCYDRFR